MFGSRRYRLSVVMLCICGVGLPAALLPSCQKKPEADKSSEGPGGNGTQVQDKSSQDHPTSQKTQTDKTQTDKPHKNKQRPSSKMPAGNKTQYALPRERFEAGWIKLFDGHSLFGWTANSNTNWHVEDGVLTADRGEEGLLLTNVPFQDYELVCEYRLQKGGNSGIFLRSVSEPTDPATDCYELNICDTHKTHPTGSLVARKVAGKTVQNEGNWQRYHVVVKGNSITATLDGTQVLEFMDDTENSRSLGHIGLQYRNGRIKFRKLLLKPLTAQPLFNGKDLTGWSVIPGAKGNIAVEEGAIRIHGVGNLQSDAVFGDFLLQTEVRTNAQDVNSGIFFRSMPGRKGEAPNGYELQIHNGFAEGDRTKPNDYGTGFGTGALFRFHKARWVVPNDKEWFTMTLIAYKDRFASWVNGYQVTDWKDTRKPNENPRRGKRLKAGHCILQGHDPGTDVSFRSLRVDSLGTE